LLNWRDDRCVRTSSAATGQDWLSSTANSQKGTAWTTPWIGSSSSAFLFAVPKWPLDIALSRFGCNIAIVSVEQRMILIQLLDRFVETSRRAVNKRMLLYPDIASQCHRRLLRVITRFIKKQHIVLARSYSESRWKIISIPVPCFFAALRFASPVVTALCAIWEHCPVRQLARGITDVRGIKR